MTVEQYPKPEKIQMSFSLSLVMRVMSTMAILQPQLQDANWLAQGEVVVGALIAVPLASNASSFFGMAN